MAEAVADRERDLERRVEKRTQALRKSMDAQRATEAALHQAQKMEITGRLTGGVAHDFNNLLAAIIGNIELAKRLLPEGHPAAPRLDSALRSADHGATLTRHLLAFARRQHLRPESVAFRNTSHKLRRCCLGCCGLTLQSR